MTPMLLLCPNCAAQLPPVLWKVVGAFVAVPFAVAIVVIVAIRLLLRRAAHEASTND